MSLAINLAVEITVMHTFMENGKTFHMEMQFYNYSLIILRLIKV